MNNEIDPKLPIQTLTARLSKTICLVVALLVLGMTSQVFAAATTYYIVSDTTTNLGTTTDGTANLSNGNNSDGTRKTTFSTTSPTGSDTRIRNTVTGWSLLGRVYTSPVYATSKAITTASSGGNGTVYLRSANTSDSFQFFLVDYDPATASDSTYLTSKASVKAYTNVITNVPTGSGTDTTLDFANGSRTFTIPATHRLALEIWYKPLNAATLGRLYCNSSTYPSHIDVDVADIVTRNISLQVGANGYVTRTSVTPNVLTTGPATYNYSVNNGSTETFTIAAPVGYVLDDVTEDIGGGPISIKSSVLNGALTRANITQNRTLVVTFKTVTTYTVTASVSGTGGIIASPPGPGTTTVNSGSTLVYTFTPDSGWMVKDVTVDGTVGPATSSVTFSNITANHTLVVTFVLSPALNNYCSKPAFLSNDIPPNVMLMLSVESPMSGVGNPKIACTGLPSDLNYSCGYDAANLCGNKALGCYDYSTTYTGYFISNKCYTYNNGTGNSSSSNALSGLFSPSGTVSASGTCTSAWSGNFLNFATTMALDNFRKAFTGGNRDSSDQTIIVGGMQPYVPGSQAWYWNPAYVRLDSPSSYTPYSGSAIYISRHNMGFSVCTGNATTCSPNPTPGTVTAGETNFPYNSASADGYSLRIKACSTTGGIESRCDTTTGLPVGILQKYADRMRFGLTSYAINNNTSSNARDGGVVRANVKWLQKTIPYGMLYHDSTGTAVTCATATGCANPEYEINDDGTFVADPMGASSGRSGLINYINKFGYYSGTYRQSDPNAELYYETIRYFMSADSTRSGHPLPPSDDNYCKGLAAIDDGFPAYCGGTDNSKTLSWRDPFLYSCSQSFIIAVNDANPLSDKRIPGSPFGSGVTTAGGDGGDYCVGNTSHPCDSDLSVLTSNWYSTTTTAENYDPHPVSGLNTVPGAEYWTDKVGKVEYDKYSTATSGVNLNGFKTLGSIAAKCLYDPSSNTCSTNTSSNISVNLGRVVQSQWNGNSYYTAGLAYFAHVNDLRKDLTGTQSITTYMIDTQEPYTPGSMLVGAKNPLYLAAKYGGFEDKDGDGKPYDSLSTSNGCGGHSTTPLSFCSEWDSKNTGTPDNYFFAANSSMVETGLQYAFNDMQRRMASGTAASILSNSEGSGANLLQAVFYPRKLFYDGTEASWIGEINNMWYYVDPDIGNSSIREDTDYVSGNHQLDLKQDLIAQFVFDGKDTNVLLYKDSKGNGNMDNPQPSGYPLNKTPEDMIAIWKAGQLLWERDLTSSPRTIYTTTDGTSLKDFTSTSDFDPNDTAVQALLQAGSQTEADSIISFTKGVDLSGYRNRKVNWRKNDGSLMNQREWRLGDVITSTPRIQATVPLNAYHLETPTGYNDTTYNAFITGTNYNHRGMAYVGVNDGMLHAFKQGILNVRASGSIKATLSGSNLGEEQWAFIPKNVLPYLKYYADTHYNHIYSVDGTTNIIDLSIMKPAGCTSSYWNCPKTDETSWATILLGSMGLGGSSRISTDATCTDCVRTPITDPSDPLKGVGYSSYFALDITRQDFVTSDTLTTSYTIPEGTYTTPRLLWEFADPRLGYSKPGIAVVRINSKTDSNGARKNGRWIGIIPSGPTGPIDTTGHQFKGRSDQNLMIFVIDLKDGTILSKDATNAVGPIDTGIPQAFAGTITSGVIDTDRWNKYTAGKGNYQDDAVYVGYTKADTSATPVTWTKGGVLRIVIPENTDPDSIDTSKWKISKVIDDIGPVTTSIAKLQDRKSHNLWLYFGTGRYYFQADDTTTQQALYGVKDLCYKATVARTCYTGADNTTTKDDIDDCVCAASGVSPSSAPSGVPKLDGTNISSALTNQSGNSISDALSVDNGWYVTMDNSTGNFGAERNVTDPVALTNGLVLFTTFMPTTDICNYGGNSFLWGFKYDTGFTPTPASLKGKVTIQVSTGAFEEKNLGTIFTTRVNRKSGDTMTGKPPGDPPPVITNSNLKPVKKIVHILER